MKFSTNSKWTPEKKRNKKEKEMPCCPKEARWLKVNALSREDRYLECCLVTLVIMWPTLCISLWNTQEVFEQCLVSSFLRTTISRSYRPKLNLMSLSNPWSLLDLSSYSPLPSYLPSNLVSSVINCKIFKMYMYLYSFVLKSFLT